MKILIVEDESDVAMQIQETLGSEFGEVQVVTCGHDGANMPQKSEVEAKIRSADVIVLDNQLKSNYKGVDLLPACKGKKVLGISTDRDLGQENFGEKRFLHNTQNAEALRNAMRRLIAA